jgi:hypothetical protein
MAEKSEKIKNTEVLLSTFKKFRSSIPYKIESTSKGIVFKSKDRIKTKEEVEKFLKAKKSILSFEKVFVKSKSHSLDVVRVMIGSSKLTIDLIFKPDQAKGAGGVKFEVELQNAINQWISSEPIAKYKDIINELSKYIPADQIKNANHAGSQNRKRSLDFKNGKIEIGASDGETLSDITLKTNNGDVYLSLKMSATYYVISASIYTQMLDPKKRDKVYEFFGMDGVAMGGFGTDYLSTTTKSVSKSTVVKNLTELLENIYGSGYIMIHQNGYNINVADFRKGVNVKITSVDGYVYPVVGARKYANIKTSALIDGKQYKIDWQFRGTTAADVGPKYMRVLVKT